MGTIQFGRILWLLRKAKWKSPFFTERVERTPFNTLVSCVLSQRTKDAATARASKRLLSAAKSAEQLMKLPARRIEKLIYPVGFYRTKAGRLKEIARVLVERHGSKVPADYNELLKLKGVGVKTAGIVMVYGHRVAEHIPVDTHVFRISNRLGWLRTKTREETEPALKKLVPKQHWAELNDLFVQFGQNLCRPVSPWCSKCPVRKHCKRVGVVRSR